MREDVRSLLHEADHVLIAFDGPLCTVFEPGEARATAERLRLLLGANLPRTVARTGDPFEVLRYAASCGENTGYILERQLATYESEAVAFGPATDGAEDAVRSLYASGHSVTAIGNQSVYAIRAFLAPLENGHEHYTMKTIFDGSRLLPTGAPLWHVWAFGTYRLNGCYFTAGAACGAQIVWHVGGPNGFDTTAVPNGSYKYCVEALTIAGVDAQRCTPVTIKN